MLQLIEGAGRKASITRVVVCAVYFAALHLMIALIRPDGVFLGSIALEQATIRGLAVQLQMFISLYLVLRESKPGFIAAAWLNWISLIGAVAYLIASGTFLSFPGIISYAGVLTIITLMNAYRKRLAADLSRISLQEKREEFFARVFEQAPIGIAIVRDKTLCARNDMEDISVNPGYQKILSRDKGQLQDVNWTDITHPDDLAEDLTLFDKFKRGIIDQYALVKRFIRPDGTPVWVDMRISPFTDAGGSPDEHICILSDITEQKKAEEALQFTLQHDALTGLFNRAVLEKSVNGDNLLTPEEGRALVGINLSGLDALGMRYGFSFGQEMTKRAAEILKGLSGENAALFHSYVNRFAFYIKGSPDTQALQQFGETVFAALDTLLSAYGLRHSIGIVPIGPGDQGPVDEWLKDLLITSELAIRETGKNKRIRFWGPDIAAEVTRENDITRALAEISRGIGEDRIYLQFQPIWDPGAAKVCAFEALARLNLEGYGAVDPDEFITVAEKNDLIVPLGEKIFHHAFRFLKKLNDDHHGTKRVSVNISLIQLLSAGFAQNLIRLIGQSHLEPGSVILELTESVFSEEREETREAIQTLKAAGIKIMIDDFGTGYSCFERQCELDVNCLKIDKIFVDKLHILAPEDTIIRDMISMAHKLGHCVVAEGVEHADQLSYLLTCGCDMIQGYLISKPLNEDAAIAFLKGQDAMRDSLAAQQPPALAPAPTAMV